MYCSGTFEFLLAVTFVDETGGIVCDLGSSLIKLGYGGEDMPKAVYPSVRDVKYNIVVISSPMDSMVRILQHII